MRCRFFFVSAGLLPRTSAGERENRHHQHGPSGRAAKRIRFPFATQGFEVVECVPLAGHGRFHAGRCTIGHVVGFVEHDVAGHQVFAGAQVLADLLVHVSEFGQGLGTVEERFSGAVACGGRAERVDAGGRLLDQFSNNRHPVSGILAGGDVRLLAAARVGERVRRFARFNVEGAESGAPLCELLFGVDEEEGRRAETSPRGDAQGQSCGT